MHPDSETWMHSNNAPDVTIGHLFSPTLHDKGTFFAMKIGIKDFHFETGIEGCLLLIHTISDSQSILNKILSEYFEQKGSRPFPHKNLECVRMINSFIPLL